MNAFYFLKMVFSLFVTYLSQLQKQCNKEFLFIDSGIIAEDFWDSAGDTSCFAPPDQGWSSACQEHSPALTVHSGLSLPSLKRSHSVEFYISIVKKLWTILKLSKKRFKWPPNCSRENLCKLPSPSSLSSFDFLQIFSKFLENN